MGTFILHSFTSYLICLLSKFHIDRLRLAVNLILKLQNAKLDVSLNVVIPLCGIFFFIFRPAKYKFVFPGDKRLPVDSVSCISENVLGKSVTKIHDLVIKPFLTLTYDAAQVEWTSGSSLCARCYSQNNLKSMAIWVNYIFTKFSPIFGLFLWSLNGRDWTLWFKLEEISWRRIWSKLFHTRCTLNGKLENLNLSGIFVHAYHSRILILLLFCWRIDERCGTVIAFRVCLCSKRLASPKSTWKNQGMVREFQFRSGKGSF